jgi:hypothetical protein
MPAWLALLVLADAGEPTRGVDLLRAIDPARDALRGSWHVDGPALIMEPVSRLQIPCLAPEEYDLVLEVERLSDVGKLIVGLGSGPHAFDVVIDNWHANEHRSGMHWLDGRHVTKYPARIGAVFANDVPARIVCTVRKERVVVRVNGREIVRFEDDFKRLSVDRRYAPPNRRAFFLANELSRFQIRRISLLALGGHAELLSDPGRCPLPVGDARWRCGACRRVTVASATPAAPRCCGASMSGC